MPSPTEEKPYHHGNLRSELLDHAERALARGGVRELSLRELAREIGVSHAAPSRHFADKQALLDALAERGFLRLGDELAAAVSEGASFRERLERLARAYVHFATEHEALLEVMFTGKHRPGAAESLREAGERSGAAPMQLIADAQAAGEIVSGDPAQISTVLAANLQGLVAMSNTGLIDPSSLDELISDAVELLTDGLRPRS